MDRIRLIEAPSILGLKPSSNYLVEIDDEEVFEAETDRGGILALLDVPRGREVGVRVEEPGGRQ